MFPSDLQNSAYLLILNCAAALLLPLAAIHSARKAKDNGAANIQVAPRAALITALKNRHEKAAMARQAKCGFLADMSHELRTPMNAVIGYSEMLIEDLSAVGQQNTDLSKVNELGKLLLKRINDVLDFAKLEMGRLPPHPEEMMLESLLADASELAEAATWKGNSFSLCIPEPTFLVEIDARRFRQAVRHGFDVINALLRGGRITITLGRVNERLTCSILAGGGELGNLAFRDLFSGAGRPVEFSDAWESSRLEFALARELSAFLGGTVALVEEANATGF